MAHEITIAGAGGEYMETVTVVAWHVEPGATVKSGDLLVTVETAKAATEIAAPVDGVLIAVNAQVGDEVAVGASLGQIGQPGEDQPVEDEPGAAAVSDAPRTAAAPSHRRQDRVTASPLARRMARQLGVDLKAVKGTGPGNRIKSRDVNRAAEAAPSPRKRASGQAGCPVVMLHGIGASSASWQPLLAGLNPTLVVERFDLPGHGRAAALEDGRFETLLAAVADEIAAAGIGEAHLVGHSLGGALALALADSGRLRARSLSLLAPAGLGPEIDGAFLSGFARATKPESLAPWLARLVADPSALPGDFARETLRMRASPGLREAQARLIETLFPDGTQSIDVRPALARLRVPAKLIWGRRDAIIPWQQALAAPGRVAVHLIADVGHMAHLEAPDTVAALVSEAVRSGG